jgi:beta-glucosidase
VAILPRAEKPTSIARARVDETNEHLKTLADNNHVWYTDVNSVLLEKDGRISEEIMSDFWHPTDKGYERMLTAMKPSIDKLLIADASK